MNKGLTLVGPRGSQIASTKWKNGREPKLPPKYEKQPYRFTASWFERI